MIRPASPAGVSDCLQEPAFARVTSKPLPRRRRSLRELVSEGLALGDGVTSVSPADAVHSLIVVLSVHGVAGAPVYSVAWRGVLGMTGREGL